MDVGFLAQQGGVGLWLPFPGRTDKHKLPVGVGPGHRRHQRKIEFVATDRPDEADARPGNRRQILRQRLRREVMAWAKWAWSATLGSKRMRRLQGVSCRSSWGEVTNT